ncbi:MAG: aspartyl protease family protein [Pseudomonadota bacterium]
MRTTLMLHWPAFVLRCALWSFVVASAPARSAAPEAGVAPFSMAGEFVFIDVIVGDSQPLSFIFDTGAGTTALNASTSARLGLVSQRKERASGAAESFEVESIRDVALQVAGVALGEFTVQSTDLSHLERSIGRRIDGIIGFHLLKRNVVAINYDTSQLSIFPSKKDYPRSGKRVRLKTRNHATTRMTLVLADSDKIDAKFILDNGAGIAVGLSTPFVNKHDLIERMGAEHTIRSRGFSNARPTVRRARIPELEVAGFIFKNVPASLYDVKRGFFSEKRQAGVIGNAILKRFNIIFDYPNRQSWWTPNERFADAPFAVNGSGLSLTLDNDMARVLVEDVQPDSPAALAGLRIDDELVAIDELIVGDTPLHLLESRLDADAQSVSIRFLRKGIERTVTFELQAPY